MRTAGEKTIFDDPEIAGSREPDAASRAPAKPLSDRAQRRRRLATILCLSAYLVLGLLANLPVWLGGASHVLVCGGCGDSGQEVWFLASAAHAVDHWNDPLVTNWINFPWGANLMDNTSMPLAGIIGTPITIAFGPVTTYSVLFTLSFAGSAAAAFFALRRYVSWIPAAFVGGLLYGFSPYMVGEGLGHLFLMLAPLPPLMLMCLDDIVVRRRHRWWVSGGALGLLAGCQLLLSSELLAIFTLMAVIGLVILAVARFDLMRSRSPRVVASLAATLVVFSVIAAFPAHIAISGAAHISGPIHPVKALAGLATDLLGVVAPDGNQHFNLGLAATTNAWVHFASGKGLPVPDQGENGGYVGVPLLVFLLAGLLRFRRDPVVRFGAVMAFVALLFSMGSTLHVGGHSLAVPLPFRVLIKLPLLQDEVASRYSIAMWLFIALLAGAILDRGRLWWKEWRESSSPRHASSKATRHRWRMRRLAIVLGGAWAVLIGLSLAPGWPYPWQQEVTPNWFTSPAEQAVPYGSTLLAYPMARSPHTLGDVWQAIDGLRYRIPAGQGSFAHRTISATEKVFDHCLFNGLPPKLTPSLVGKMQRNLRIFQVFTVVVPSSMPNAACASSVMGVVLGRQATFQYGAYVWTRVPRLLAIEGAEGGSK